MKISIAVLAILLCAGIVFAQLIYNSKVLNFGAHISVSGEIFAYETTTSTPTLGFNYGDYSFAGQGKNYTFDVVNKVNKVITLMYNSTFGTWNAIGKNYTSGVWTLKLYWSGGLMTANASVGGLTMTYLNRQVFNLELTLNTIALEETIAPQISLFATDGTA